MYNSRGRPPEHEDLRTINLMCNARLIEHAKQMNINISEVLRNALESAVDEPMYKQRNEIEKKLDPVPLLKRKLIKRRIMEDKNTSEKWSIWCKEKHDINITPIELQIWVGY